MPTKVKQEVIKPWAVYYLTNQGAGIYTCFARFATRGDAEVCLFSARKSLPKNFNPTLVYEHPTDLIG